MCNTGCPYENWDGDCKGARYRREPDSLCSLDEAEGWGEEGEMSYFLERRLERLLIAEVEEKCK